MSTKYEELSLDACKSAANLVDHVADQAHAVTPLIILRVAIMLVTAITEALLDISEMIASKNSL